MSYQTPTWITENQLESIAEQRFKKSILKAKNATDVPSPDPTLTIMLGTFLDIDGDTVNAVLRSNSLVKTFQNAIGLFHQDVLGSVDNWTNNGHAGGVIDIMSNEPVNLAQDRLVVAEVKMRHNTIKASDERSTFDKLKDAAATRGGAKKCVAYVMQIVPKTKEPINRPWKVSGRTPVENVRQVDGRTAYHLVTGDPQAFDQLMHILPTLLQKTVRKTLRSPELDWNHCLSEIEIDRAINAAIPQVSALD